MNDKYERTNLFQMALFFHFEHKSDSTLLFHSNHVSYIATLIANQLIISNPKIKIDMVTVHIGALLHDIGRTKTHTIRHGVVGGNLLKGFFSEAIVNIAKRHIGGGIPREEAISLGLPAEDYVPITLEEKIVCYADKLVDYDFFEYTSQLYIQKSYTYNSVENEINKLAKKLGSNHPAIQRLQDLEKELWTINRGPFQGEQ